MSSRFFELIFSKHSRTLSRMIRNYSKSTQAHIALLKCNRFRNRPAVHRYFCTINTPELTISVSDSPNRKNRKTILSIKDALKVVKEENYFSLQVFPSTLVDLKDAIKHEKLSYKQAEMFISTDDFIDFFKALENNFKVMPAENLVITLVIWNKLHLPPESELCEQILLQLNNFKNSLQFNYAVMLHYLVLKMHGNLKHQLLIDLQDYILENLKDRIYTHSITYAISALLISKEFFVPEKIKEQILNYIMSISSWNNQVIYQHYLQALVTLPPSNPSYLTLKNLFFQRLLNEGTTDLNFITTFLAGYSLLLREKRTEYDEKLLEGLISKIINRKANLDQLRRTGMSLVLTRHVSYNFLVYMIKSIKNDYKMMSADPHLFRILLLLLANSNHNHEMSNRWSGIKSVISASFPIIIAVKSLKDNKFEIVSIALNLILLGITDYKAFTFIMEALSDLDTETNISLNYLVGILNQSLHTLFPNFKETKLEPIINEKLIQNSIAERRKEILNEMMSRLDWKRNMSDSMLFFACTKRGMVIDGLVAMNDKGDLFSFTNLKRAQKLIFIEDISLPPDFKPIVFSALSEGNYTRNTKSLKGFESLKLRTLEAMGYPAFYILEDEWNKLDNEKKGQYLLKEIYKKSFENHST